MKTFTVIVLLLSVITVNAQPLSEMFSNTVWENKAWVEENFPYMMITVENDDLIVEGGGLLILYKYEGYYNLDQYAIGAVTNDAADIVIDFFNNESWVKSADYDDAGVRTLMFERTDSQFLGWLSVMSTGYPMVKIRKKN